MPAREPDRPRVLRLPLTVSPHRHTVAVPARWVRVAATLWGVVALYVAQIGLPDNVVTLPGQEAARPGVEALAPQGWAFFTRSPREARPTPYAWRDGGWENLSLAPHAEHAFDRRSRHQTVEIDLLLDQVPQAATWRDCDGPDLAACLAGTRDTAAPTPVTNRAAEPTLCGELTIVALEPVSFAWRDSAAATHTPQRAISLVATC